MSSLPFRTTPAKEDPPPEFLCPITLDLMRDPVAAPTGITYDRAAITSWLLSGGQRACPVTHAELRAGDLVPNHTLRRLIQDWCDANDRSCGGVGLVPATPEEAAVAELESATRAGDAERCAAAARWVRRQARMAERNRGRLASAGAGRALAAAFASFADAAAGAAAASDALDAVLAALALVVPMDEEAVAAVGSSSASVARLVAVAANGGLLSRLQAVVVIGEIISLSCHRHGAGAVVDLSANTDAIVQVLVKTIKDAICPQATRACLLAAHHLACAGESAAARLAAAGLVPVLVELLIDADRSTAEKALAALDAALVSSDGRARARADALAVPVLVKKMFCVSDAATELVLSALLRICKKCPEDDMDGTAAAGRRLAIIEALQVGALQKVLLLLQAGCSEETKEKATELLRVIVRYQGRVECVDTMDFRGLKRGTTILTT
ncbi:U-box domain-containing protein 21-like [Panicum virgatum]|uniref:U-box domain-containing protein n=1 Tax=Panicum virgatum TaxID=38727 RepID=A0A8T0NNX2_PANVG|nr:U-box domain-containing protein 21-like [Panicum virgatum]KAG2549979.1 hypothetical protein PVAP13_9KG275200 [Panicum virgatum]